MPPEAARGAAQKPRVAGRDELPEPARGWGNGAPKAPPKNQPEPANVNATESCLGFTENGCRIDHSRVEVEIDGETTVEEQLIVSDQDGNVAIARPTSRENGELPDEMRPSGGDA